MTKVVFFDVKAFTKLKVSILVCSKVTGVVLIADGAEFMDHSVYLPENSSDIGK